MFAEVGITPRPCQPTQNLEHVQWMVKEGHCYSLIRAGRTLMNGLVARPVTGVDWTIDTGVVVCASNDNPALSLFIEELIDPFRTSFDSPPKKPVASAAVRTQRKKAAAVADDDQMALFKTKR
jgi:hypothetical protein